MRVLAIDTALEACSAAVLDTERGGILASESIPMLRGHAEALLPLVSRVMTEAGMEFTALDRVAVTVGPGSFTGLRVGVSAARGIAVAAGKPAVGLTTLAALAAPYIAIDDMTPLVAAIDARNDQVYMQMFGAAGRSLIQPRVASLRDAVRDAANARARLVGSAAAMMAAAWPASVQPPPVVDAARAPIIDWVAHLGAAAAQALSLPKPLYLRAPDAQPQDAAHLPRR
ncbi:MAG TPA: tRNA (adenosine(37)-N6)-threonylcarbamoyltransferase complex dimerization subunit type 1 TsaB [Xanthobacteraceae bacterium]|jgi:tRNA threonylcarbamoyl adenosine modification protein YeaZ|nr:tRNA (adenosine(37)-N6)-threonylcarbamoyltransferase complex dimerization subunit type 1 TsaB [Xanthobacteraceae bacterium]